MTVKLDLYKEHQDEYVARQQPAILKVKPAKYLTIEGSGDPGGKEFQDCVGALYAIAFTIKMAKKFASLDYHVAKLEGLWSDFKPGGPCKWKLMIRTPEFIKQRDVDNAVEVSVARGKHSMVEQGYKLCGPHHEIYLSDPRRVAPEKLRTILRHCVVA